MKDLFLEIAVGVPLCALGLLVMYAFVGDRAWDYNSLAYCIGALTFSVPAIIILERRRRRRR